MTYRNLISPTSSSTAAFPPHDAALSNGTAPTSNPASHSPPPLKKVLTKGSGINRHLQHMEYAVRGELVLRAEELAKKLKLAQQPAAALPFDHVTYCNIGNPQSVGQPPITFVRQALAAAVCPSLIGAGPPEQSASKGMFPPDVEERVKQVLEASHGVGAYSDSRGLEVVRARVADAIRERDGGIACDPEHVFLTNGASDAVKTMLGLIVRGTGDGVMIPIPQYPLYSASMTSMRGVQVGYYLDEDKGWSLSMAELQERLEEARGQGVDVRAIVIINPGNPTGQVLTRQNMEGVIRFCEREGLVILADEVYQQNVYVTDKPFISFKKVVTEMHSKVELASFHSVSKGVMGECGLRGGYMEVVNMHQDVIELIYKVLSVSLCSNVIGQLAVDLMMTPPKPGEPSYELYNAEVTAIFESLRRKALALSEGLNSFEGVSCNPSEGAMYLFPRITIPEAAKVAASERGMASPDVLYCVELLEQTGICVVPGSGFGQKEGTYHFRTTFLPPEDQISDVIEKMRTFHSNFMKKYSANSQS
uniref:Alanine transaminase n=1 Tax=Eucheuma denticulatum TaxID=305493 RepID=A0A097IU03_9FLOR|nr:alanine transaminase [Eucheuma denticulatum]|eukprot:GFKZ01010982.1.p1 GENE.GFKZ01010982.1~~GFKZ01010982.1.p1  ORF type:complete len:548 (-),score=73.59 GFKZ01010982.1:2003-3604(-)